MISDYKHSHLPFTLPKPAAILGHLLHNFYAVRVALTLLETAPSQYNAMGFGCDNRTDNLLSDKCLQSISPLVITLCSCIGKCDTSRCSCKARGQRCVMFCHKKQNSHTIVWIHNTDEKEICDLYMYVFSKKWQRTILFHYSNVIILTNDHIIFSVYVSWTLPQKGIIFRLCGICINFSLLYILSFQVKCVS